MRDARYWILDARYWILDARYWLLVARYWILDARYWLLVAGFWLLAACCLLSDAGYYNRVLNDQADLRQVDTTVGEGLTVYGT